MLRNSGIFTCVVLCVCLCKLKIFWYVFVLDQIKSYTRTLQKQCVIFSNPGRYTDPPCMSITWVENFFLVEYMGSMLFCAVKSEGSVCWVLLSQGIDESFFRLATKLAIRITPGKKSQKTIHLNLK